MPESSWLEVSLIVDGELAEAVAEVLARYIESGVAISATAIKIDTDGEGTPTGPLKVSGYIPVDERLEDTRQKISEALWYLGRIRSLPEPEFRTILDTDWMKAWKEHYHPIPTGQRLIIVPAWLENPQPDRLPVKIDPGMAFGTGTHPSTQLCLELVEEYVQVGQPVIDVGCGSGILSVAALKLGASHALGVDIDPLAVKISLENAEFNEVGERFAAAEGSVAEILSGRLALTQAPLVLANILAPVIARLLDDGLAQLIAPGGVLALAGIVAEQWDEDLHPSLLKAALARHGLDIREERRSGDWVAAVVAPARSS